MRDLFRRLFRRSSIDAQVREEIETHIAMRAEQLRQSGMTPAAAERVARRQFGSQVAVRETLYEFNGFGLLEAVLRDLMYALRGLTRNKALSLTATLTIAIGVGATTSMFSIMRNILLAPPPDVVEPDRVFRLHQLFPALNSSEEDRWNPRVSYVFYELLSGKAQSLDGVAAYGAARDLAVGTGGDAGMTRAVLVSAGFWSTLGVQPALGRFIRDEEAHPATGARVVVLGHGFWRKRFGSSASALGQTLRIKGQPYEIVGVAPRGFRGVELADVDLWLPLFVQGDGSGRPVTWHTSRSSYSLGIVGRLKPDVTAAQAAAEVTGLQRAYLVETYTPILRDSTRLEVYQRARALLGPVTGALGDNLRPIPEASVTVWLVGVAIVLVGIACLNVAGLLLLRALRRRREIAVRLALGVSRGRLALQLLTESSLLAVLGGMSAILTVAWGGAWLQRIILPAMAWEPAALIHPSVLAMASLSTLAAILAAGVSPLWYTRSNALSALHDGSRSGFGRRPRIQSALLVTQGALSVVLLIGAGLFVRSLHNMRTLDIGLDRDEVLVVQLDFSGTGRSDADIAAFFLRSLERVATVPGVTRASLSQSIPLRSAQGGSVRLPGQDKVLTMPNGTVPFVNEVTAEFFQTTGMRILQGRGFLETDRIDAGAIVVNETMAKLGWPDRSPIGDCVYRVGQQTCTTIVGVVADARRFAIIDEKPHPHFYVPMSPTATNPRALLVRMASGVSRLDGPIRQALNELDPGLPYIRIETLGEALNPEMRPWLLGASMFTACGVLAMVLAMIGLWSSVSYAVSQRRHEFAVRLAVGASRVSLLRLVLREGLRNVFAAVAAGVVIAAALSQFIAHLLFQVAPRDPLVYAAIGVSAIAVAAVAGLLPAWRASRVEAAEALRTE